MGRAIVGEAAFAVFAFLGCFAAVAQNSDTASNWKACATAPTRACVLDQALALVLSYRTVTDQPPAEPTTPGALIAVQLKSIAESYANAGDIEAALRVAASISEDHRSLVSALCVIASSQVKLGRPSDAKETLVRVRLVAAQIKDPLDRAEALQFIGKTEAEAGMATEGSSTFEQALTLAETIKMPVSSNASLPPPRRPDGTLCSGCWRNDRRKPDRYPVPSESRDPLNMPRSSGPWCWQG
jgi:hypothetical protein